MDKDIDNWKILTDRITSNWIKDYFQLTLDDDFSVDWVANDIGGIFSFADYWFDFNTVLKCYELSISRENLFLWYDWNLTNKKVNISLAKFILSPQERKEAEEKHLAELKERVDLAEKEFKKAIEDYEHNTTH